jgi:hypothetical protein
MTKSFVVRRSCSLVALACFVLLLPVAAAASGGGGWSEGEVLLPVDAAAAAGGGQIVTLPAVACPSSKACTAVGSYMYDPHLDARPLVVTESSGIWHAQGFEAPMPPDATATDSGLGSGVLSSVACVSAGNCTAVGAYDTSSGTPPLLVTESAGKWRAATPPAPPNGGSWPAIGGLTDQGLTSVSCAAAKDCAATFFGRLLAEAAGTWSIPLLPLPVGGDKSQLPTISSASCPSVGNCVAAGTYTDISGEPTPEGLIETQSGGSWTASRAPLPSDAVQPGSGPGASLKYVLCLSAGNCTAVGYYASSTAPGGQGGLLLTESNGVWSASGAPLPANVGTNSRLSLDSLACSSAGNCAVVGTYEDDSSNRHWLVLTEADGAWTAAEVPLPASLSLGGLNSVTCPTADACLAVGDVRDSGSTPQLEGLVVAWSGLGASRQWGTLETVLPSDSPGGGLNTIVCVDLGHCSAVGSFTDGNQDVQGLLLTEGSEILPPLPTIRAKGRASAKLHGRTVTVFPGITLFCPAGANPCAASASASVKRTRVGKLSITFGAGTSEKLSFKLTKKGVRLLRRTRSLRITLKGVTGVEQIAAIRFKKSFTIKRPRGLKPKH